MKGTILEKIVEAKRVRVEASKASADRSELLQRARDARANGSPHRFRKAVSDRSRINIIAEFKKASPSKGVINEGVDPAVVVRQYQTGGAAAISVLTEEDHFAGSIDDLRSVRAAVDLPILRKDFIFDPFQIFEAAAAGADAILLIAAMLDDAQLSELEGLAEDELNMDALVELHSLEELERISKLGPKLIGVNNRDLHSFEVSLNVSRDLIKQAPPGSIMIAESGLNSHEDIIELKELGYSGFLIGETLMRSGDPESALRKLAANYTKATNSKAL